MRAHRGRVAHRPQLPRIKTFRLRIARGTAKQKYSVLVLPPSTPLAHSMLLGVWLHHVADVHFGVAGGDLEQAGRLRALLNVAQLSGARLALPFDREAEFGIQPHRTRFATGVRAFVLDGAPAVHRLVAHLMAGSNLLALHFYPIGTSHFHVGG